MPALTTSTPAHLRVGGGLIVATAIGIGLLLGPVGASRRAHDARLDALQHALDVHLGGVSAASRHAGVHPPWSSNLCHLLVGAAVPATVPAPSGVFVAIPHDDRITLRLGPVQETHPRDCHTCTLPGLPEALEGLGPGQALWFLAEEAQPGADWRCR